MNDFLTELAKINPVVLGVFGAFFGMIGAIIAAMITGIVGKLVVTPFLGARDKQDREVEWRKHAIELTKLDLDRRIKTRLPGETEPLRPSILDFLANYRDLQELGQKTPKELYLKIKADRITHVPQAPVEAPAAAPRDQTKLAALPATAPVVDQSTAGDEAGRIAANVKGPARPKRASPKRASTDPPAGVSSPRT